MEFGRYEWYRDSGIPWLGEIPDSWRTERGKWLFRRMERPVRSEDEVVTAFRDGEVTLRKNRRTEGFTNAIQEHGYQGIRKGDLVIHAMDAFAGAIGVSDSDGKSSPVYSACIPRKSETVNPYFYAYLLRFMALSGFILSLAKGIRERSTDFRFSDFGNLELPVPGLEDQNKIVRFLDERTTEIDQAVAQKRRLIDLLKEQKAILINQAVTKGLNPGVAMWDSGVEWLGEIPAYWYEKKTKFLFRQSSLPVRKSDEIVTAYRDGEVTLRNNRRTEGYTVAILEQGYQGIRQGQLVINSMDAFAGAIGVSDSDGKCSPEYVICDPINPNEVNPNYFALLLRQMAFAGYIEIICPAVRQRALRFRFRNLSELKLPVPPILEQQRIAKFVDEIERSFKPLEKNISIEVEKLREMKSIIISLAVTGKIRVP